MSTKTELTTRPVATLDIPFEFVKVCHYGVGKFVNSPVMLTLPKRISEKELSLPCTLVFAEAFIDVYNSLESSSELQSLRSNLNEVTSSFQHGRWDRAFDYQEDLVRRWRQKNLCGYPTYPSTGSAEDLMTDRLGLLACAAEANMIIPSRMGMFDANWMEDLRLFDPKRALIDSGLLIALGSGAGAVATQAPDPLHALWFGLGLFMLRFSTPFTKLTKPTALKLEAYRLFAGSDKEKKLFAKAMTSMTDEEIFRTVRDSLHANFVAAESKKLDKLISEELFVAELEAREMAADLEKVKEDERKLSILSLMSPDSYEDNEHWQRLRAQQELLTELKSKR